MKLLIAASALMIAVGYFSSPLFPNELVNGPLWVKLLVWCSVLAPLLPILAVLIGFTIRLPFHRFSILFLATAVGVFGAVLSFFYVAFSGVGMEIALVHGLSLTFAVVASVLLLTVSTAPRGKWLLLLAVPVVVATWSLVSLAAITFQAGKIADGRAFCLGPHKAGSDVEALAQLRGLAFYSTESGYKFTSRWYFHGILLVRNNADIEAYNWSPRRLAFQRIARPQEFLISPLDACKPKLDFLDMLTIW